MPIPADSLRILVEYTGWASRLLVDAVAGLTPEELNRDFQTADRSVLGTLVHTFAADRLWFSRLSGGPHPGFITDRDRSLAVLQTEWPALHDRWLVWAGGQTDESLLSQISYTDLRGNAWKEPAWQLVLHVVNHGTHHRGQVSGFLRTMGHVPPALDLLYFYRARQKAAVSAR